jgi:hypothetical protein
MNYQFFFTFETTGFAGRVRLNSQLSPFQALDDPGILERNYPNNNLFSG